MPAFELGGDPDSILTHYAEEDKPFGAVVPPIFQNSLFLFDKAEDLADALTHYHEGPPFVYSRSGNPTVDIVERKIAALEGMGGCKITSGGIGAIAVALSSELEAGAHAVIVDSAYGPTRGYLEFMSKFGVSHTCVPGTSVDEIADAVKPETKAIYLESPSSILFRLQDLPAISKIARERKITTFIDNTYCTPLYMRPAEYGIDVVLHSGSKYFGGHSDINAGAICADSVRIERIVRNELSYYASLLHPFSAWLMLRGLRTLRVRVAQHEIAANYVAGWLETQPQIERVRHISLESFPQRDLFLKLMKGSTGLFSFEPKVQTREAVFAFADALKIFGRGISWGGFESLVVPLHHPTENGPRWLVRLFCGLEDPEELRKDVEQALQYL
ncbi:MAG TPA: PLP-dependent aspartate aminotransferase family protein [Fimbriimonas sp.]|nr:PLP-dependent aspartate aminotransferase family protein [Fimbriimonas sp.]